MRETREEVAKSGDVLRESRLVFFEWSGGGEKKRLLSSFLRLQKSKFRCFGRKQTPSNLLFSAQNEILGKKISRTEEKNTPKKVVFAPKVAGSDEKGRFWGRNHREGIKRKIELYY